MSTATTSTATAPTEFPLSCAAFASRNQVKPESVRVRLCKTGSYFGVKPLKLANGRLAFPDIQVTR